MTDEQGMNQEESGSFDDWLARMTRTEREIADVKALRRDVHDRLERLLAQYLPEPRSNGAPS